MSKFIEISVDELTALQNEIKQAKILIQQLRDSKKPIPKNTLYDYVFENVTSALMLGTPDGRIIEVNSAACKIFGYSKEEFLTKTRTDLLVVDENFKKFLSEREKNGIARAIVINKRKNGEPFKSELSSNIFKDQNGTEYACFNVVDISEKEKLEALLKETSQTAMVGGWEVNLKTGVAYMTDVTKQIHELPLDFKESVAAGINFYKEGESRDAIKALLKDAIEKGISYDTELMIVTAKGNERWIRTACTPVFINGECVHLKGIFQDIHQRKLLELALAKKNEEISNILDASYDVISVIDKNNRRKFLSPSAEHVFGYKMEELMVKPSIEMVYQEDLPKTKESMSILDKGLPVKDFENRYVKKNGGLVNMLWSAKWDSNLECYYSIGRDITKQKMEALKKAKEKLKVENELKKAVFLGEEKQKNALSLELHDNINQILTATKMFLGMYIKNKKESNLTESIELLDTSIKEIRKLSHSIVTPKIIENGLKASLEFLLQHLNNINTISYHFVSVIEEAELSQDLKLNIYRILQELITNCNKHSNARNVWVNLLQNENILTIEFMDDGVGFDVDKKKDGIGLINIRTRVTMFNGKIDFYSEPDKGVKIFIVFDTIQR